MKRKPKPDAPEGVVALVQFIIGHWKMITTAIAALAAVWYFGEGVLNARDLIILKPEAMKLHEAQEMKIAGNEVRVKALYDGRIEQLTIQPDRLIRQNKLSEREKRDLADIEKQIEIAKKMRDGK